LTLWVAGLAAVGAVASCKPGGAGKTASQETVVRAVQTEVVGTGDLVRIIEGVGSLEGDEEVRVFPLVPERIAVLNVKDGDYVRRGAVLAVLVTQLQDEGVKQAQAALEAVTANREVMQDNVNRTRQLVEAGAAPRSQLETLEKQLTALDAQVRQVGTGLSAASMQRDRTVITAPISGVVTQLVAKAGDMASPSMPLCTVVKASTLKAAFNLPEREFLAVEVGMSTELELLGRPEVRVTARVSQKSPVVDRMTRTGRVEVRVGNDDNKVPAGAAVRGRVEVDRETGVILVPARAILLTGETERTGAAIAFVVDGETARKRDIVMGARQGKQVQVRSGLKVGERLVVQGQHLLRDGNPVRVLEAPRTPEAAGIQGAKTSAVVAPAGEVRR
jgi:RND family efflux transporter MFP subunit